MNKSLLSEKTIETLVQDAKKRFSSNNDYYSKAMEISESMAVYNKQSTEQQIYIALRELKSSFLKIVKQLITVLDHTDQYTKSHCQRVTKIALAIGKALSLPKEDMLCLEFAGLLHDIGKAAIPSEIINKEGRLTQQEYEIVKLHPDIGYQLIKEITLLIPSRDILLQHHERIDGKGYPRGLKGEQIDIKAKILSAADAYDAMTSSRPYRKTGLTAMEAVCELERNAGTQFDPAVIKAIAELIKTGEVA